MRKRRIQFAVSAAYVWIAMVAFGGIAVETIIIYPNVFHNVPDSLAGAMEFFAVTGPADFFPPMGAVTVVAAVATVVLLWRVRRARPLACASLAALVLGEFLFSVLFFWPRNDIMFEEGLAVHSAEVLRQAAFEFETGHWVRLAMSAVTATLAFAAFLRFHTERALEVHG
ncbi:anthrone oxygenase family protein [Amycolatopsis aidingensis]|uniref:anthrone oxygenase family protein n=1 Tax=Amycolatopsis aidingensis TaxID=2842453 RepID=UPI001C0B2F88|nr:anthrone oxygenase family protein [Amycolatopsis aidingensis]